MRVTASARTLGSMKSMPLLAVGAPAPSRYGPSKAAVKFSATPSRMSLTLVARNRPKDARSRRSSQAVDLFQPASAIPPVRADHPRGQPTLLREPAVGVDHVGQYPGVLPGRDPEPVELALGEIKCLEHVLGGV